MGTGWVPGCIALHGRACDQEFSLSHKSCLLCVLLCLTRAPGPGRTMTWAWAIHRHRPGGVLGLRVGGLGL